LIFSHDLADYYNPGFINFLLGCAGGLGVNIYRLYEASQQPKEVRPPYDSLYIWQVVGLSLLGGVCALANHLTKPVSPITAFNLGLSIPALIKAGADAKAKKPRTKKPPRIN
jgi:hypothetical protein